MTHLENENVTIHDEDEYVLGTHAEELKRLGLQHSVWRPCVMDCWQRAGITLGSRVIDVGCGPGCATTDLAEIVGADGRVVGVDQSARFVRATKEACAVRLLNNVDVHECDLMTDPLPVEGFDAAWTRWVACFVPDPDRLVHSIASALRPSGVAIFHEYVDYATWKLSPPSELIEEFVQHVMRSWRMSGGEPDIARTLPATLRKHGLRVRETRPHVFCAQPRDHIWHWPWAFIDVNLTRLQSLGLVDEPWVKSVRREMSRAESNPDTRMITPMVLEIVAEKTLS